MYSIRHSAFRRRVVSCYFAQSHNVVVVVAHKRVITSRMPAVVQVRSSSSLFTYLQCINLVQTFRRSGITGQGDAVVPARFPRFSVRIRMSTSYFTVLDGRTACNWWDAANDDNNDRICNPHPSAESRRQSSVASHRNRS